MADSEMQSSMSWLLPPEGEALPRYIEAVVEATAARSEAALAEIIGVPASAIGNWKRRLRIPSEHAAWFASELVREVVARNRRVPDHRGSMPKAGVLRFLSRGGGNPFKLPPTDADLVHADLLAALVALARLAWTVTDISMMEDQDALDAMAARLDEIRSQIAKAADLTVYQ